MNYIIEKASPEDLAAILKVMAYWNMHHVPSAEMEELDLSCFFVARVSGQLAGAAGYKILSPGQGKTTLLGIRPEFSGMGIGKALQDARLDAMYNAGVKKVTTNADREETILWYKKHYGYRQIGTIKKICDFSLSDIDHWTTLEMDLEEFMRSWTLRQEYRKDYIEKNDPHPLSPYPPLIINACLTGMVPTKFSNPNVPIQAEEIIEDAVRVFDAGARVVHLHARDEKGEPTPDAKHYEKIISPIKKERPGIVCCVTTSGRNWREFEQRAEVLYLSGDSKPDMASLTLGSLNFFTGASVSSIEMIERLALTMREREIKPELEIFDTGMINLAKYLERNRLISGRKYFNLLLGNINTAPATIADLAAMVNSLPENSIWAGTGLGQFQLPVNGASIVAGGHVRVGIEDAIYFDYGKEVLATNENLVKRIARIASEMQRPIATVRETREMMGLAAG
ncbi:MAG: GNAT family N-acetyltransferase [Chlorobiaceae bacterium]|nr:GNAT family N-acetyltransferase [Chlorobiaceae bacterium]